jgi:hypothetical protein
VPPNIGLICIEVLVHIYIGVHLRNPSQGGCAGAGSLIAWGGGVVRPPGAATATGKP